jgi:DNA polymerase III subunit beta
MTCKATVQKNTFSESLAIVGRAVGSRSNLPILSNILLSKDGDQLRLSATDLTLGVTVWMDANLDGDLGLTLPAKTLTDVINSLTDREVVLSVSGKPEVSLKCGTYKGIVKGIDASEFPTIPEYPITNGVSMDASMFKEMIQKVAFAASMDDARPVLTGVLMSMDGKTVSMVGTDGFRLAICKAILPEPFAKKQLIIPAAALKEVMRILTATKTARITLVLPTSGSQVVFRCENVQIVSQLIDGKFPDYQAILPKGHKTRAVLDAGDLLKACKQANIIAREGSNVVRFHFQPPNGDASRPGADQTGKVKLLAESDETGASEIELDASVEGQELEIAFNVKFLQDGLEAITTKNVTIEANAHNTPAVLHSTGDEENLYVLMPMHIDGR